MLDCLQLFAYDSPDAGPPKELLSQGIDRQMSRCDVCIVEYYRLKKKMMEDLRRLDTTIEKSNAWKRDKIQG